MKEDRIDYCMGTGYGRVNVPFANRSINEVLAAYCRAMAERIYSLLERIGVSPAFAITGGMAKNMGVINRLRILQSACGV